MTMIPLDKIILCNFVDYPSNVFDSPYENFIKDFKPRDESIIPPPEVKGPNDDRNFLT